ncbi:hypothetical protein SAMN05216188_111213 [Lentzea xinjiangensis]|uniref:Uncharacterized protein n=1 Tax=Lentzea xinjiangensis TaxID=402600 RepID=A0A1H9PA54_9PSEU|nr:hypothetical protein [Lentzea xinjiangensis]SER44991.1 hypothetical protein SAMN05216188_111213 [Lentzea xinjiangensis]
MAHNDFCSYVPAGSPYRDGAETVDGTLLLTDGHPAAPGEAPSSGNDRNVGHRLVDTFAAGGMWAPQQLRDLRIVREQEQLQPHRNAFR